MDAGADSGWTSPGTFCGADPAGLDVYCPTATRVCCSRHQSGVETFECVAGVQQCIGGSILRCDDRTDCPASEVCCGAFHPSTGYKYVRCQQTCNGSPIPNVSAVRFCDPNAPVDECQEISKTCSPSGALTRFYVCK